MYRRNDWPDLYKLCDEAGIKRFCVHALRHTYATRAIGSGMQPMLLQQLLGHASIKTTMDRYVHVTADSLTNAARQFEHHPFIKKWRSNCIQNAENTDETRRCDIK